MKRGFRIVNKKVLTSSLALAFLLLNLVSTSGSNLSRPAPPADVLSFLPASDAVAVIDVHRLLTEALPRIFAGDPAKLLQANAEIEKFKTRTGIDPRTFDRVALGLRYTYPSATVTKIETVAIAHGTFDARALVAAGRIAASGKYREVSHHGATIAVFNIGDQIKFLGLWNMKVNELAACALDRNTLAIGSLANVRAAIEAGKSGRASGELVALATRDPNALIGLGGNVPAELLRNLNVGNDAIAKDANSIRQIYGSIGMTETDFTLLLVARTATAADARNLSDTVMGLKQLGGILIARMAPAKKNLAQSALDSLKITTRANELEIRTQFAAADLSAFLK
ncbi:MAG: hypothetical protein DMF70_00985 [Acidobacteria bacterium]|nr:MAG: hypothetical protein DMF70_00985 [Acidobacteriota bacterium]